MKRSRLMLLMSTCLVGFCIQSFAQDIQLSEVEVIAVNYKYLNAVEGEKVAIPVKNIEEYAAAYDVKNASFYEDDYDHYFVSFFIPDGKVLAAYDRNGKLLRTVEKFKNTTLPPSVGQAVAKRFPQWKVAKDTYLVTYHEAAGATKKYKLLLENGNKRMRVKLDERGEFIQ
jgi:hypothetical protein